MVCVSNSNKNDDISIAIGCNVSFICVNTNRKMIVTKRTPNFGDSIHFTSFQLIFHCWLFVYSLPLQYSSNNIQLVGTAHA